MYFYGVHLGYIILIVASLVIGGFATWYCNHQLRKYKKVPISLPLTGADAAYQMMRYYGITGVQIVRGKPGKDCFDPRSKQVSLGPDSFYGSSVTALATACHEVGHAFQYAEGYMPMRIRGAIVPVANVASNLWIIVLLAGIFLQFAGLINIAIILYACVVIFELVTLPVEFNASNRAKTYMETIALPKPEQKGAARVLRSCALTYVAAALVSILQLLYLLVQRDN